jgi:hypothetical protein
MIEKQVCMCSSCNAHRALEAAKLADANLDRSERVTKAAPLRELRDDITGELYWIDPDNRDFRAQFKKYFPSLSFEFIQTMSEIGNYGLEKYKEDSFQALRQRGELKRVERTGAREIVKHSQNHGNDYLDGIPHDKFGTRKHQLGAGSFNYMMEFIYAGLDKE